MQEAIEENPWNRLRTANREELSVLQKRERENFLRRRRLKLCEVETLVTNATLEQFREFVWKIKQKNPSLEVLKAIKNACQTPSHSEAFFRSAGAFDALIKILLGRDALLQLEAVACLTNLACGSHKASRRIAKGAGAYLISFITGGSYYLQDQSAWAAGNIAYDCQECYFILKAQGLLPALLAAIKSPVPDVVQSIAFALHACTKYEDPDLIELSKPDVIKSLLDVMVNENIPMNAQSDTSFALTNICCMAALNNVEVDLSTVESIVTLLCKKMCHIEPNILISLPMVRCLGFLSTRYAIGLYLSHHLPFYDCVNHIMNHKHNVLKSEILWVLTNIAALRELETLDSNLIYKVTETFLNPVNPSVLQALYYLCILASKNKKLQDLLDQPNVVSRINVLLQCGEKSIEIATKIFCDILKINL